ncbi:MAG: hypothetical protein A2015_08835 [Spirochaetes bacterium GWF1_31_7]|nr:MAG: hypothetical protein A2Y30_06825 [Spirochaetes bacterium GWE1_32_154]OHD48026.1 MAG: hypothetical protein A2015_08835 [Spirochaetes bacterium GWF1_31_7]OHD49657.1 MAG: hypothetical protein A2Y29_06800 [Spirochaetes bacterium GWE2_31_10]HBD92761.1 hypothetical protein [Spirochaetia bacterium]HBI36452.1 hypothetical protein [Spirochaetia bacterium]
MKYTFVMLLLVVTLAMYSIQLEGIGFGVTQDEAKANALKDLAGLIESNVKTEISRVAEQVNHDTKNTYSEYVKSDVNVKTDLPIMGATFQITKNKTKEYPFSAKASFDTDKSIVLYKEKLKEIGVEVESLLKNIEKSTNDIKLKLLNELMTLVTSYQKYRLVSVYLAISEIPDMSLTKSDVLTMISGYQNNCDSIEKGALLIAEDFKEYKGVFIYPATPANSNEVTQFSKMLNDYLSLKMSDHQLYSDAKYYLRSNYDILNDGIHMVSQLFDKENNIIKSRITRFLPASYINVAYKPEHVAMSSLLNNAVSSSDMKIELTTNKGKTNLLFIEGEEIELLAKVNRSGFIYFAGYVLHNAKEFSYLLELNEAKNNRKFIVFVNDDDVNKWISLGKFQVSSPFGVESLQAIASTKDLIDSIPDAIFDSESGYYVINGGTPEKILVNTRGLKPKETKVIKNAETSLMFTTYSK